MSVLCLGEVWLELNAAMAPELTETFRAQTGGRCQAKSADNTGCIIEHFGNADAVPQPSKRCLSR